MLLISLYLFDVNKPKKWILFPDNRFIFVNDFACLLLKAGILARILRWALCHFICESQGKLERALVGLNLDA